jgi:hypothetical protein
MMRHTSYNFYPLSLTFYQVWKSKTLNTEIYLIAELLGRSANIMLADLLSIPPELEK